jgi:hypothetical protein
VLGLVMVFNDLNYEFTENIELIQEYNTIAEICYQEDFGVDISAEYERYNKNAHFLIVKKGKQVIGGARLIITNGNMGVKLPMEEDNFLLKCLFTEYSLYQDSYGEICRVVIAPDFRRRTVLLHIFYHLVSLSKSLSCYYLFSITEITRAILYRRAGKQIGINIEIRSDIEVPYKEMYKRYKVLLLSCNLESRGGRLLFIPN